MLETLGQIDNGAVTKYCKACRKYLELSRFSLDSSREDGLAYYCKEHQKLQVKTWRNKKSKEWLKEYNTQAKLKWFRKQNPEFLKQKRKEYRDRWVLKRFGGQAAYLEWNRGNHE